MFEGVCGYLGKMGWREGSDGPTCRIVCGAPANDYKSEAAASHITCKGKQRRQTQTGEEFGGTSLFVIGNFYLQSWDDHQELYKFVTEVVTICI